MLKKCRHCGEQFNGRRSSSKHCSRECAGKSRRTRVTVGCSYCQSPVETTPYKLSKFNYTYCNIQCRAAHLSTLMTAERNPNYNRLDTICDGCGDSISVQPHRIRDNKHVFCSNECYKRNIGKFQEGFLNPMYRRLVRTCEICGETITRIASSYRGEHHFCSRSCYLQYHSQRMAQVKGDNQRECDYCGKLFHIKPSAVSNRKTTCCSVECASILRSIVYVGVDHPRWNPDITDEERLQARSYPEYVQWRKDVFFRDGYTCVSCGDSKGGNLVAHHVRNYAEYVEGRTDVDNGVTLCETCHVAFHNQHGYTGNTEKQLIEFIHKECA